MRSVIFISFSKFGDHSISTTSAHRTAVSNRICFLNKNTGYGRKDFRPRERSGWRYEWISSCSSCNVLLPAERPSVCTTMGSWALPSMRHHVTMFPIKSSCNIYYMNYFHLMLCPQKVWNERERYWEKARGRYCPLNARHNFPPIKEISVGRL